MSAISGRDAPDMARLPPSSPAASSVGHDKTGHTFRKIAIAAGLVAAVSFFAIAIFATLAIPPIAVVTLPAMTFMAIVGGLAITGTLAASIALVSSVAARVFSHGPQAARAPVAEDIEYVPSARAESDQAFLPPKDYSSAAQEIQKLKLDRPVPVLTVDIDETQFPVHYQINRDFERNWGVAYNGVPIPYEGSGSQKVKNTLSDLYQFCDSNPTLTENVSFLMTQGETAIPLTEWQKATGKSQKLDGQWLVDLNDKGSTIEIHHYVPFVVIDPELAEVTSEKYWIEVLIALNKEEVSHNDFHSTTVTHRTFPRTQDTSTNIADDKLSSDYATALENRYKQIATDRPVDVR